MKEQSKFLDDRLYSKAKDFTIVNSEDFIDLITELHVMCEKHYKKKLTEHKLSPNIPKKEVKAILDQVFNAWDSMIRMLKKENWFATQLIEEYSFKKVFLTNPDMNRVYNTL